MPEPTPISKPKTSTEPVPVAMEQAMQEMAKDKGVSSTDGLGCFWIPGFPYELFFCFNKGELGSAPYLYHYLWGGGRDTKNKLQKIENIARDFTASLRGGGTRPISRKTKTLLSWISKWQESSPFNPSTHCKITLNEDKGYKVTCSLSDVSGREEYTWNKEISHEDIVEPSNKEKIKEISK